MTDSNHNLKVNFKVKVFFLHCQIGGDAPNWAKAPVLNQVGRKDGDTAMKVFERLVTLMLGLFPSLFAFADGPGRMGEGMMGGNMMQGMGGMGLFMMIMMILLVVLLILAILALIKYLRNK